MVRPLRPLFVALWVIALGSAAAHGQTLNWDPTFTATATGGGPGNWDTTTANWFNGTADVAWPGAGNIAVFGGASGGLVSIQNPGVSADGLTFNTDGYTIGGPGTLTLTGATPTFSVATGTATVSAVMAGTAGLTMAGPGTLVLSAANTYTSTATPANATTINAGTIQVNASGALGPAANGVLLGNAGGTLQTSPGVAFNTSAT